MPRFDGTGPFGRGPLSGRGTGPCNKFRGKGFGRFFNPGRFRNWFTPVNKEEELNTLKQYKKDLEQELEQVKKAENELSK